jgi:guanine nucleotide-binding protein subunit alpha
MDDPDPFACMTAPPPGESPEAREARERAELEAKQISEQIDEVINQERFISKKKRPVKILLLGQSESGASSSAF